mmetsp:Transcript_2481/g.5901  ORF Transcript_2481/g.5901 Transcript_2481/m.5901 type:complete len:225 (-) Transcript_2481:1696-2370(-)
MLFFLSNFMILHARLMRVKLAQDLEQSTAGVRPGSSGTADFARFATRIDGNVREGEEDILLASSLWSHGRMAQPRLEADDSTGEDAAKAMRVECLAKDRLNATLEGVANLIAAQIEHSDRGFSCEASIREKHLRLGHVVVNTDRIGKVLANDILPHGHVRHGGPHMRIRVIQPRLLGIGSRLLGRICLIMGVQQPLILLIRDKRLLAPPAAPGDGAVICGVLHR